MEIRLEGIEVAYDGVQVLKEISTIIPRGSTTAVVGPSGCGKTTFLKLINGLVRPKKGVLLLEGKPLDYPQILQIRRGMGYVMQESGLFPHLNVETNISLLAQLEGWPQEKISRRVEALMHLVNLPDSALLKRSPRSLSGGQRQRIALARALMLDPPILLMDEPFSALDPVVRRELQQEFLRLKSAIHRTILLVTHDFAEAYRLGDRILLLNEGRIEQEDAPGDFVQRPATPLAAAFIASARGISS